MDTSQISDIVVAISIAAGAFFAIIELRSLTKDRKTQLVISLMNKRGSKEFTEMTDKIWKTEFATGEEASTKLGDPALNEMANFYEQVGLLIDKKLVDANLVFESIEIDSAWQKLKPWCFLSRSDCGPRSWEHFEMAAAKDREYEAKRNRKRAKAIRRGRIGQRSINEQDYSSQDQENRGIR